MSPLFQGLHDAPGVLGTGEFIAEIYSDAPDAAENAKHSVKEERRVNAKTVPTVNMAPNGGRAVRLRPVR